MLRIWKARKATVRDEIANGFCRALPTCGCRPRSTNGSGFQQLFFPDGIAFEGNRFVGTGANAPAFSYLREITTENEDLVDQTGVEPFSSAFPNWLMACDFWHQGF